MPNPEIDIDLDEFRGILAEALAEGGTQPLLRLTDEEIAVLDPESLTECVAPTPRIAELSGQEREWVYATALRSLVSREAVEVANIEELDAVLRAAEARREAGETPAEGTDPGPRPSGVDLDLRITPEVSLVLTLRRTAARALAVEQHTSSGRTHLLVYVHADDLHLVERVTSGGLHMFTLAASAQDAADMALLFVDPFEVAAKDGPVQHLTPEQISQQNVGRALGEAIDNALVVGQTVLLADTPGPLLTTYATDQALWTVYVEKPHALTGIEARPVGKNTLRALITKLISPS
ncbi:MULTISPECIES: hypothetical protein [unclassified Streptomyces]|uniref:hypothetical protein n=1 Tax=unclassified Streptomyces TaxID=2593676 RepID=UPI0001B549A6|nr:MULTISPECIES: hypothetical protein [unclassified Streptomyces]EFL02588.1 predicted protein [Streptomyces sp. SPB78]MYR30656.1 hypothetical protein [Streptomyces sp. SID4945]SCF50318.1 hypothetical protein GA0115257_125448 [Streptomyces sp. LcepLS]